MRVLLLLCFLSLEPVTGGEPAHLQFSRIGPTRFGLFLANADGRNERALLPADSLDYTPSFSVDGKWIVFTSERDIWASRANSPGLSGPTNARLARFHIPHSAF